MFIINLHNIDLGQNQLFNIPNINENQHNFTKSTVWLIKRFKKEAIVSMANVRKHRMKSAFEKWKAFGK